MQSCRNAVQRFFVISSICGLLMGFAGCERKEKVLDIQTPAGSIEIERSTGSGEIKVDVDVDKK